MSRKALSAKLNEDLLKKADQLGKKFKISRNRALEEGLKLWVKTKSRELLAKELAEASSAVRKESREAGEDWEGSLLDGLKESDE